MNSNQLNDENKSIWDSNAKEWDAYMGEDGNNWHKELIAPDTERLLNLSEGDKLLDIGCGNGLFARRMAKKGVKVTAFDFSPINIQNAEKYDTTNIEYLTLDATSENDLKKLEDQKFDGLVSNMVLMDVPNVEILFSHIKNLLSDKGSFVFSIQHPCFNSEYTEVGENDSIIMKDYLNHDTSKGTAIPTQKQEQYYFHRPLNYYMNLGFANGLIINGFVESSFAPNTNNGVYSKFPPILIVSMKKV